MNELSYKSIKKLSQICYNIDFNKFKNMMKTALRVYELDDSYAEEKFQAFKLEGLDWLCRLDDETAERFFKELIK